MWGVAARTAYERWDRQRRVLRFPDCGASEHPEVGLGYQTMLKVIVREHLGEY